MKNEKNNKIWLLSFLLQDIIKKTTKKCWAICLYVPYCWCR